MTLPYPVKSIFKPSARSVMFQIHTNLLRIPLPVYIINNYLRRNTPFPLTFHLLYQSKHKHYSFNTDATQCQSTRVKNVICIYQITRRGKSLKCYTTRSQYLRGQNYHYNIFDFSYQMERIRIYD